MKTADEYLENKPKDSMLTLRIGVSLKMRLQRIAKEKNVSISKLLIAAAEMYLDQLEKKKCLK